MLHFVSGLLAHNTDMACLILSQVSLYTTERWRQCSLRMCWKNGKMMGHKLCEVAHAYHKTHEGIRCLAGSWQYAETDLYLVPSTGLMPMEFHHSDCRNLHPCRPLSSHLCTGTGHLQVLSLVLHFSSGIFSALLSC